jgi:hypothetical protein
MAEKKEKEERANRELKMDGEDADLQKALFESAMGRLSEMICKF